MNVLICGAGVIGCFLAHTLCEAGQQVTLLARGSWKDVLAQNGLTIVHHLQRKTTTDHPNVIEALDNTAYDVVFAAMQHQQLKQIAADLGRANTPLVICVGNNLSAPELEQEILNASPAPKRVLFGFQETGGRREGDRIVCIRSGSGSMKLGGLHGHPLSEQEKATITSLFSGTAYRLFWMENMDAWYRCHLAFILPVAYLCYATGCNLRKSSRQQRRLVLDAANESCTLLKALGYEICPAGDDAFYQPGFKRLLMAVMLFLMFKTVIGDLAAADHCRHAVSEMEGLDAAWSTMREKKPDLPMPAFDALRSQMPPWTALHRPPAQNPN